MTATIIAEALAAAEAETPLVLHHHRGRAGTSTAECLATPPV